MPNNLLFTCTLGLKCIRYSYFESNTPSSRLLCGYNQNKSGYNIGTPESHLTGGHEVDRLSDGGEDHDRSVQEEIPEVVVEGYGIFENEDHDVAHDGHRIDQHHAREGQDLESMSETNFRV